MKSEVLQFVFCAIALIVCASLEELFPKGVGVGFPLLLTFAVSVADRKPAVVMVLVALAAGAVEDALSSLPIMASPCFFLAVAACVWRTHFARVALMLAYPIYAIWLTLIVPGFSSALGMRVLMAAFAAIPAAFMVLPLFAWLERKAAVDEA